jgi:hypothetical protein
MPVSVPVPDKAAGDVFTEAMWDSYIRDNINKLLNTGHRVLTVAQFSALVAPEDGDEAYVEVDATNGIMWHFRYVAAEPTYKWRFLGGPPLYSEVTTSESTSSTTYTNLTTVGPSVSLPMEGDYMIEHGNHGGGGAGGDGGAFHSYQIGATAASDSDACTIGLTEYRVRRTRRKQGLGAVTVTSKYRTAGGTYSFSNRELHAIPIRVKHA